MREKRKQKEEKSKKEKSSFIDHRGQRQECEKDSFFDGVSFEYLKDDY